ncbi:hypothetical protein FRB90_008137, partial [Tulasnella sp. 427]
MSYPNYFSQTDPPHNLPRVPSPSPFSPEGLQPQALPATYPTPYGSVDHAGHPQGPAFGAYTTPYATSAAYYQPGQPVYSHPHHASYPPFQTLPPHLIPPTIQPQRAVLGDANVATPGPTQNTAKEAQTRKRKGTENNKNPGQPSKRQRQKKAPKATASSASDSQPQQPTHLTTPTNIAWTDANENNGSSQTNPEVIEVPGVGPSLSNGTMDHDDDEEAGDEPGSRARDAWYFMRPLDSPTAPAPDEWPNDENERLSRCPQSNYVGCKLCSSLETPAWRTWKKTRGITSTIRRHLANKHSREYSTVRTVMGMPSLQAALQTASSAQEPEKEPFTMDGFIQRLLRWIVVDDQSIRVLECPEFRDLLTYVSDHLDDEDIPHRTKLTNEIISLYQKKQEEMYRELKAAPGRVSFTSDLWSDPNLVSYMALTAHWIAKGSNGEWTPQTRLLAFKHVKGSHSGANLANEIFEVLESAGILHKIGSFTMDNASNNDSTMSFLEVKFTAAGILFHRDGHRIRCFPHVINIATQTFLHCVTEELRDSVDNNHDFTDLFEDLPNPETTASGIADVAYKEALLLDPLGHAIKFFLNRQEQESDSSTRPPAMLTEMQLHVLKDIQKVLKVAHLAQQALSTERTPTLAAVLRSYDLIVQGWEILTSKLPNLKHAILAGLEKIKKYERKSRQNHMFVLAIALNPSMKLQWIEDKWGGAEADAARLTLRSAMLAYRRDIRRGTQQTAGGPGFPQRSASSTSTGVIEIAAQRQENAMTALESYIKELSAGAQSLSSMGLESPSRELNEEALAAEDEKIVDNELERYIQEARSFSVSNMYAFWSSKSLIFPLISSVATDVLA